MDGGRERDERSPSLREIVSIRGRRWWVGLALTIAAAAYLRMTGRPPVVPSSNLSYAENFLYMLDSLYVVHP
ncbi:hypothetical protein ACOSQ2_013486 [Xanthoceras sorbifolium]